MRYNIAVISTLDGQDYLVETILDGLDALKQDQAIDYFFVDEHSIEAAQKADLILLLSNKFGSQYNLAARVDRWGRTAYIDGSELGKNNRYDREIQRKVIEGTYEGRGAINREMLKKCALYFRREKPYSHNIIPLPFGIERRYIHYQQGQKKDVDFACIFGQDKYPPLRREATEFLESWCHKNGFTYATKHTSSLFNRDFRSQRSQDRFYDILARTKVGISVGGGGFDTLRFWEILANNCTLLTEQIDIYELGSSMLEYQRIFQFKNINEFEVQLEKLGILLKTNEWKFDRDVDEYQTILDTHSTKARVLSIVDRAKEKGIL
ncbi:MAG: hypothetical protein WC764_01590 [Candidatus Paceibacterota bacterium]|jgi:hypothetical protein